MIHRTFEVPLKDNTEFEPRYNLVDLGLNPSDFYSFNYIDVVGAYLPPKKEIVGGNKADRVFFTQYVPDSMETAHRREITSLVELPGDLVLKLVSLPDVKEVDTTMHHLSYILKSALGRDKQIETIIEAIKEL